MWLSKNIAKQTSYPTAEKGEVTLSSGDNWEADASRKVRNTSEYLPYGYSAVAPVGEEVLLLPLSDGLVALGTKAKASGLKAGEVKISSRGGASILLKNDGSIVLNGAVTISRDGQVTGW